MQQYSIDKTYEMLKAHMTDYIKTNYLGKNDELRKMCSDIIADSLCQEPYIEVSSAYVSINKGISENPFLTYEKESLVAMCSKNLKVIDTPYIHQVQAMEEFHKGNDLFVATGTGSGKTECFMWPMISSIMNERTNHSETWSHRGVRALILYPMNALVSDQLSRLRKMIGDEKGNFHSICDELNSKVRYPQFGMYTGRTPYAGKNDSKKDSDLAKTLLNGLVNIKPEAKESLINDGKYPSKYDLKKFIDSVRQGEHITDERDAELITRQEMISNCPDILVTNYSMLQYMLIRPTEQPIWNSTKNWLESDKNNKIIFIIDEAHMYKGASGGEVVLLIRRFMHKLGIDRSRLRFILTSASVPENETEAVEKFACNLSAEEYSKSKFKIISGEKEKIITDDMISHSASVIAKFYNTEMNFDAEKIKEITSALNFDMSSCNWSEDESISYALSDNLSKYKPMLEILKKCRGNATKLSEISAVAYPDDNHDDAVKATSVLMGLATLAKKRNGVSFFPARMHMFFKGITGLYGCINPECPDYNEKIGIGRIYTTKQTKCSCGGKVFELYNDRSCGTIFLKGYLDTSNFDCLWSEKGLSDSSQFSSVVAYLPLNKNVPKNSVFNWMNVKTGRLFSDDSNANKKDFIKVCFAKNKNDKTSQNNEDIQLSFSVCPHCEKRNLHVTDFATKGNEPFYHLVSEQLHIQQPTITDKSEIERTPNEGRKVLLFSDSRQTAAVLAKDLTKAADDEAMKKAIPLAAINMIKWCKENNESSPPTLKKLYIFLLEICYKYNLKLFYGDEGDAFDKDVNKFKELYEEAIEEDEDFDYFQILEDEFSSFPGLYNYHLLVQFCSNFRSFVDIAICWLEPTKYYLEKIKDKLKKENINILNDDLLKLLVAWINEVLTDSYSLDKDISKGIRENITKYNRFGIDKDIIPKKYTKLLKNAGYSENEIEKISVAIDKNMLLEKQDDRHKYINPAKVTIFVGENHEWYKCEKCGGVFPFSLYGKCARCCKGEVHIMDSHELSGLDFWRKPVMRALKGDFRYITGINTEEHTAQLSHKDQRQKMLSSTEDIERRFKNIYIDEKDKPVDILSSTTTMEVGIDIGSLTAIGLRNVPPMRENYQQRAGRAGRRGSSISTIITYVEDGPHDMFYYENPKAIISGEPRIPWIDNNNSKLSERHINVICITEIIESMGKDINSLPVGEFFDSLYDLFKLKLNDWNISEKQIKVLLPSNQNFVKENFVSSLLSDIELIKDDYFDFKENYRKESYNAGEENEQSLLDVLLSKGVFPTYSFPRNVVGFNIDSTDGKSLEQRPDRGLNIAISEYAPGKIIVVNKKTYKSGGIYSFYSKFRKHYFEKAAAPFFENENNAYRKMVYCCDNQACNWFGTEKPKDNICPFCHNNNISNHVLLVPWGFAPQNARSIHESEADSEFSYAESPCYSITPNESDMMKTDDYMMLRYTRQVNQPLIIMNQGLVNKKMEKQGFTVCKKCGAIVAGNDEKELKKIGRPYNPIIKCTPCHHYDNENVFLGDEFITDLALFEIELDSTKINTSDIKLWLESATITLSQAILLASSRVLDIEYSELNCGYRLRYDNKKVFADIFIYDSLSSGAGYSFGVVKDVSLLLKATENILKNCPENCDSTCHSCLSNYYNKRYQLKMNRFNAFQLMKWAEKKELAEPISVETQYEMSFAINEWLKLDGSYSNPT